MIKVNVAAFRPVARKSITHAFAKSAMPKTISSEAFAPTSKALSKIVRASGDGDGPCGYSMDPCGAIP